MTQTPKGRVLVSVTDKTGLEKFKPLADAGWEFISTGGTATALKNAGIESIPIEKLTDWPEMMGGRLKTLHPKVHGGILAIRDDPAHMQALAQHAIGLIDVVVVNLYAFEEKPTIENIDIGGPALLRGAAKNAAFVAPIVDPADYDAVIAELLETGTTSEELRKKLAIKVFKMTAGYDAAIAKWMEEQDAHGNPFLKTEAH